MLAKLKYTLIAGLTFHLVSTLLVTEAQQGGTVRRVGFLSDAVNIGLLDPGCLEAFRKELIPTLSRVGILVPSTHPSRERMVMAYATNPVERGLVASLARPGGNVTGVAYAPEGSLVSKRMELLKAAFPRARRLGMLDDGLRTSRLLHEEAAA